MMKQVDNSKFPVGIISEHNPNAGNLHLGEHIGQMYVPAASFWSCDPQVLVCLPILLR